MATDHQEVERLREALNELRLINNLLTKVSQVREVNHIMSLILKELMQASDSNNGVISLVSRISDDMSTVVRSGNTPDAALPHHVGEMVAGWVLSNKAILAIDDLDADLRLPGLNSLNGLHKSLLCAPMTAKGEMIGVITLSRTAAKGPYTESHTRMVGIIATQAAQLLANARLCEELARKNDLLETARHQLNEENARLKSDVTSAMGFENIIARSAAMKHVLVLASKFAGNDSAVLITGETGVGKELIARAIHYNSPRRSKPFVIKNCGIKTESLLESELFGHVKGSFTGADKDKAGLFKEANGGTIFLDEIGDAPLATQAAILRVIQNGEVRPLGSSKTEYVNVRVLSATNKDLAEEIKHGTFREDMYYRLNTFAIHLPPLRERVEDIPLLAHHFLQKIKVKLNNADLALSPAAMDLLLRYGWPGNIRQLEHELERAAVVCGTDNRIDMEDLSVELQELTFGPDSDSGDADRGALREAKEKLERGMISASLSDHNGNLVRTAEALGLTRKGLKDKMTRYGLREPHEKDQT
jgi:transcriptional regulator with GAF, ATPase, and Fis domain